MYNKVINRLPKCERIKRLVAFLIDIFVIFTLAKITALLFSYPDDSYKVLIGNSMLSRLNNSLMLEIVQSYRIYYTQLLQLFFFYELFFVFVFKGITIGKFIMKLQIVIDTDSTLKMYLFLVMRTVIKVISMTYHGFMIFVVSTSYIIFGHNTIHDRFMKTEILSK